MSDFKSAVINAGTNDGDAYKRFEVSPDSGVYQCGCCWEERNDTIGAGDVLIECEIHHQASVTSVKKFDAERKLRLNA